MLYLAHFSHGIGEFDDCRMCVPSGQNDVHHLRLPLQRLHHFRRIQHTVADGVIDFVQHHQVPFAGLDRLLGLGPGFFHHPHIFRVRLLGADFHKAAPHLLHDELIAKSLDRIELPIVPRALQKLQHQDPHPLPHRPQGRSHGGGSLPLARPGIHDDETTPQIRFGEIRHKSESSIVRGLSEDRNQGATS